MRALSALRHPRFRLYTVGVLLSLIGNWIEAGAFGYVVLLLGGSAAALGVIGFASTVPNLLLALPGGALADRYGPRNLLLLFQGLNLFVAGSLATLWITGNLTVVLMGVIAVIGGSLGALSFPAFQAMLAATVPVDDLESAVAINSLSLQLARFLGPAIAGILLSVAGPGWVFGVNAASFLFVVAALAALPDLRATASGMAGKVGGAMSEGLRYVFGNRSLASLMALMVLAGLFGTPPVAFMVPAIARYQLHGGAGTVGTLLALIGLGSFLGSIVLLRVARRTNKGEPMLAGFFATGAAIAIFGLSPSPALSYVVAVLGGIGGVVFVGLSTVVVQATASDELRARAMAIWAGAFVGMLPFGGLLTSALTSLVGPGDAVLIDGLAVVVGGFVVLLRRPQVAWLGCAALPEACVAAVQPEAVATATR